MLLAYLLNSSVLHDNYKLILNNKYVSVLMEKK